MKYEKIIIFILLTCGILYSCDKDNDCITNTELIGNWKLIEILVDIGNGDGTFNSVESDKIITFKKDGSISSNGNLCDMSISSDNGTSGTYSISQLTITSTNCNNSGHDLRYERDGNILIINYPCFEPCQAKYIKE